MAAPDLSTNPALLRALADPGDHQAWLCFVRDYRPMIEHWCRRWCHPAEVEEVAAKVLAQLARALPTFGYDPSRGRFRDWLRVLVHRQAMDHHDALSRRPDVATGRADDCLHLHPDPASLDDLSDDLSRRFAGDLELAQRVVERLLRDGRLSDVSWRIYQQHVLAGRPAAEVARENGVSTPSVYQRCYRVAKLLAREGGKFDSRGEPA